MNFGSGILHFTVFGSGILVIWWLSHISYGPCSTDCSPPVNCIEFRLIHIGPWVSILDQGFYGFLFFGWIIIGNLHFTLLQLLQLLCVSETGCCICHIYILGCPSSGWNLFLFVFKPYPLKGGVHIMGEICPRSDPDIAHMRYYLGPLDLKYR